MKDTHLTNQKPLHDVLCDAPLCGGCYDFYNPQDRAKAMTANLPKKKPAGDGDDASSLHFLLITCASLATISTVLAYIASESGLGVIFAVLAIILWMACNISANIHHRREP